MSNVVVKSDLGSSEVLFLLTEFKNAQFAYNVPNEHPKKFALDVHANGLSILGSFSSFENFLFDPTFY